MADNNNDNFEDDIEQQQIQKNVNVFEEVDNEAISSSNRQPSAESSSCSSSMTTPGGCPSDAVKEPPPQPEPEPEPQFQQRLFVSRTARRNRYGDDDNDDVVVNRTFTWKVVLAGDLRTGKTCLTSRICTFLVPDQYEPSIGAAFAKTDVVVDNSKITLQMWDTSGAQRYRALLPIYCRSADIAVVMFDVSNPATLASCKSWIDDLTRFNENCTLVVVGSKIDLPRAVSRDDVLRSLSSWGVQPDHYFELSAATEEGVNNFVVSIARLCFAEKSIDDNVPQPGPLPPGTTEDDSKRCIIC